MLATEKFESHKQWICLGTVGFSPLREGRYVFGAPQEHALTSATLLRF